MQVKQEEIEGLNERVKEMMTSHDEEVERLNKVVEHYREDFEQEKQDMDRCVLMVMPTIDNPHWSSIDGSRLNLYEFLSFIVSVYKSEN